MAFWRRYSHGVVVFYREEGKQCRLGRDETRHLDTEPDHNIDQWVANWSLANEGAKPQTEHLTHADTLSLVEAFCTYLVARKKSPKTIAQHRHNLTAHCLPFFVSLHQLTAPALWPTKSVRLLEHLEGLGVGARTINTANVSMRVFWNWLLEEGKGAGPLLLRNAVQEANETPLNFTVTPEEVLAYAYKSPEATALAWLGFFFSLRPQEVVALRPSDFRAGKAATELECCKVMAEAKLYGRLAVNITRQRVGNKFTAPKSDSKGWVACFHEEAARVIVEVLRGLPPDKLIFEHRLDWLFRVWKREGYPGLTLKDLRRASIYWLGHHTKLPFIALKNHARHSDPSTTALYVRRPGEDAPEYTPLDLDA